MKKTSSMGIQEREVLKQSLKILRTIFKDWVKVERRNVVSFTNPSGQYITIGKKSESDLGGWILKGKYIAKPIGIEIKKSDFNPSRIYGKDKERFNNQCNYLRDISRGGGVGFWVSDPRMILAVLFPVLINGAKVSLDGLNRVVVTQEEEQH